VSMDTEQMIEDAIRLLAGQMRRATAEASEPVRRSPDGD
jgi:hypothetical protein